MLSINRSLPLSKLTIDSFKNIRSVLSIQSLLAVTVVKVAICVGALIFFVIIISLFIKKYFSSPLKVDSNEVDPNENDSDAVEIDDLDEIEKVEMTEEEKMREYFSLAYEKKVKEAKEQAKVFQERDVFLIARILREVLLQKGGIPINSPPLLYRYFKNFFTVYLSKIKGNQELTKEQSLEILWHFYPYLYKRFAVFHTAEDIYEIVQCFVIFIRLILNEVMGEKKGDEITKEEEMELFFVERIEEKNIRSSYFQQEKEALLKKIEKFTSYKEFIKYILFDLNIACLEYLHKHFSNDKSEEIEKEYQEIQKILCEKLFSLIDKDLNVEYEQEIDSIIYDDEVFHLKRFSFFSDVFELFQTYMIMKNFSLSQQYSFNDFLSFLEKIFSLLNEKNQFLQNSPTEVKEIFIEKLKGLFLQIIDNYPNKISGKDITDERNQEPLQRIQQYLSKENGIPGLLGLQKDIQYKIEMDDQNDALLARELQMAEIDENERRRETGPGFFARIMKNLPRVWDRR